MLGVGSGSPNAEKWGQVLPQDSWPGIGHSWRAKIGPLHCRGLSGRNLHSTLDKRCTTICRESHYSCFYPESSGNRSKSKSTTIAWSHGVGRTLQTLGYKAELPNLCFEYWVRTSNLTGSSATLAFYCCQVHNFMQMLETTLILSLKTWPQGPTQYMPMGWKQRVLQLLQLYQVLGGRGWGDVGGGTEACNRHYSFSTKNCYLRGYLRGIPSKRVSWGSEEGAG